MVGVVVAVLVLALALSAVSLEFAFSQVEASKLASTLRASAASHTALAVLLAALSATCTKLAARKALVVAMSGASALLLPAVHSVAGEALLAKDADGAAYSDSVSSQGVIIDSSSAM